MKNLDFSKLKLRERTFWYVMFFSSLILLGFSLYKLFDFSSSQILGLCLAFATSIIVNKYRYVISKTQTAVSAEQLVIFWGVIWLGIPGGVLLTASILLAKIFRIEKSNADWFLYEFFVNTTATFFSGSVFYLTLKYTIGFAENFVGQHDIGIVPLISASSLMAITHLCSVLFLLSAYLKIDQRFFFLEFWETNFNWTTGIYLLSVIAALLTHVVFFKFGLAFGVVIFPVVFAGHLIYKIFLRKLAQKTKEIREASRIHLSTVEALATAIDARDQIGVGHVRRTQIYAVQMGELMNLSADELKALNAGALLHGIGKLAIPDNILNKPGKLTVGEKEKTKIHSVIGGSIIENIDFPYPVAETVRYYTEMWSGEGYPEGLKGENIPLTARVLAVVNAYDTMRCECSYRAAATREQARLILQNGAGTKFDPNIVDIFLRNLHQFERVLKKEGFSYDNAVEEVDLDEEKLNKNYVEQIRRANREVYALYELARVFSSSLNLEETFTLFAEKIREFVPFDTCVIYLFDENKDFAKAVYAEGKNGVALEGKCVGIGEGATGYVLQKNESVQDINPALDFSFDELEFVEEYSAMACVPLIVEENSLGAVSIYSCELDHYGEEYVRLLEMVARIAADAIAMALQHAESETRALTDSLTGLPNTRSLQIQFEKEVARASRNGSNFQLLMLDLDGFKAVNDTYGHKAGDRMLRELSKIMKAQLRDYDFLARYAGDEFVIIVPETNASGILELCERLEKAVTNFKLPIEDGKFAAVGVSLGASCYPKDGETIDQIIISADKKMYSVKAERKLKQTLPALKVRPKTFKEIEKIDGDDFIVELDESHIISTAIN